MHPALKGRRVAMRLRGRAERLRKAEDRAAGALQLWEAAAVRSPVEERRRQAERALRAEEQQRVVQKWKRAEAQRR